MVKSLINKAIIKKCGVIPLFCLIIYSCNDQGSSRMDNYKMNSKDENGINITVSNVYNNIVVDSNEQPDFEIIKKQFVPKAHLGYVRKDTVILRSPSEYFNSMEKTLSDNNVKYLREWEIKARTDVFGNIAQRTSLYAVHFNTTDSLAERGIINFQLVKVNGEWKILSMIWEAEKGNRSVPESYFN